MNKFWRVILGWLFILVTLYFTMILLGLFIESNTQTVVVLALLLLIPFMIWFVKVDSDIKLEKLTKQIIQLQSRETE